MNRLGVTSAILTLTLIFGCTQTESGVSPEVSVSQETPWESEILQSWHGDFPVGQLTLLPEKQRDLPVGFIDNATIFQNLWKAFRPDEKLPEIDFQSKLLLFVRNTQFYNRISIGSVKVTKGVAEVLAMETMSAMPIEEKVGMSLAVVARSNIHSVQSGDGLLVISD